MINQSDPQGKPAEYFTVYIYMLPVNQSAEKYVNSAGFETFSLGFVRCWSQEIKILIFKLHLDTFASHTKALVMLFLQQVVFQSQLL